VKIYSVDEIPIIKDGFLFKYVSSAGDVSGGFASPDAAIDYALKFGGYELVPDEAEEPTTAAKIKPPTAAETKSPTVTKAESPTVTKTQHFDGFQIDTYSDGTYGYMTDGGKHKEGYKSKDGAEKAGKKLAAKTAKSQEDTQAKLLEKQAQELQEKLQLTYADAIDGMTSRIEASLKEFAADDAKWQADVAAGKKDTKAYEAWRKDQALHNDRLKALKKALTQDLTAADKMAMAYVNQVPAGVYAEGMNFATYEIEHGAKANTSFTPYDKNTVMELVANEPDLLPQAAFDKAKDSAWNSRHVTSAVTQAVLQGQTAPQLAASIAGIAAMDERAAMKAARTAITSAHSLGKLKGYERAAGMGIDVKKQWLAALDSRTRGSHRHLDGEVVKLDAGFSNGLKYPGDPDGPASEVYNCRCTLVPVIGDVEYDEVERADKLGKMSYEEWKAEKLTKEWTGSKDKYK
jgi:SPP1 gp7 family putative phage head morphogenesis protein